MEITIGFVERIRDELDLKTHVDYSGRSMYGKRCFAISGGPDSLMKFALNLPMYLAEEQDVAVVFDVEIQIAWQNVRWDDFGRDMIFYWPDVEVVENDDPDEALTPDEIRDSEDNICA